MLCPQRSNARPLLAAVFIAFKAERDASQTEVQANSRPHSDVTLTQGPSKLEVDFCVS